MAKKRLTKAERDDAAYNALRQRVADIYCGAAGCNFDFDDDFATADLLSRVVPALQANFKKENNTDLWLLSNLDKYDRIDSATDFLFTRGVRA